MRRLIPTESQEQIALMDWARLFRLPKGRLLGDFLIKIPNDGKRSFRIGRRNKAEGLKSGVSDLFLAIPCVGSGSGLWIELKRSDRKLSRLAKNQLQWLDDMRSVGYAGVVCYGWHEARLAILQYLGLTVDGK